MRSYRVFKLKAKQETYPPLNEGEFVVETESTNPRHLGRIELMKMKNPMRVEKLGVGKFYVEEIDLEDVSSFCKLDNGKIICKEMKK